MNIIFYEYYNVHIFSSSDLQSVSLKPIFYLIDRQTDRQTVRQTDR